MPICSMVGPLSVERISNEASHFHILSGQAQIASEVLTADERLRRIVATHPGLLWKAQNVGTYRERRN